MNFNKLISLSVFLLILIAIVLRINIIYNTIYPKNNSENETENFIVSSGGNSKCDFKPEGNNELHCISLCKENENCFHFQCENICGKCNGEKCPWDLETEKYAKLNILRPVTIKIETSEGTAKISFKSNKDNVKGYMYQIYKTNDKAAGITIGTFTNKDCITCEKVLKGLSTTDTYTVSVKPYNDDGVGDESNKISFIPIGELRTYDFNIKSPIENLLGDDYEHCN